MGLILPNLDDKAFEQIAEEARLLIPSSAPEWTDHNIHDPGITFVELFAWLAEMEHYRLNRTARTSYERFFSLMGITPLPAQAAEASISIEFGSLPASTLLPANTRIEPIGIESIPFETIYDQYLTPSRVTKIVTHTGGRDLLQTTADKEEVGHYEAFGLDPAIGDFLRLEFDNWFTEPQAQLEITLFDSDLPAVKKPLGKVAPGFEPSATIRWEYRRDSPDPRLEWEQLDVIRDGTLSLSRSGELVFRIPADSSAGRHRQIRAVLTAGRYEIPPRIASVRTNTIKVRQVETISAERAYWNVLPHLLSDRPFFEWSSETQPPLDV